MHGVFVTLGEGVLGAVLGYLLLKGLQTIYWLEGRKGSLLGDREVSFGPAIVGSTLAGMIFDGGFLG